MVEKNEAESKQVNKVKQIKLSTVRSQSDDPKRRLDELNWITFLNLNGLNEILLWTKQQRANGGPSSDRSEHKMTGCIGGRYHVPICRIDNCHEAFVDTHCIIWKHACCR